MLPSKTSSAGYYAMLCYASISCLVYRTYLSQFILMSEIFFQLLFSSWYWYWYISRYFFTLILIFLLLISIFSFHILFLFSLGPSSFSSFLSSFYSSSCSFSFYSSSCSWLCPLDLCPTEFMFGNSRDIIFNCCRSEKSSIVSSSLVLLTRNFIPTFSSSDLNFSNTSTVALGNLLVSLLDSPVLDLYLSLGTLSDFSDDLADALLEQSILTLFELTWHVPFSLHLN